MSAPVGCDLMDQRDTRITFINQGRPVSRAARCKRFLPTGESGMVRSSPPDGDCSGDRARPGANSVTVVAGLNDPLSAFLAHNLADMVRPDDHGAYARRSTVAPMRPVAREIECRAGIAADKPPHLPAAPRRRAAAGLAAVLVPCRIAISFPRPMTVSPLCQTMVRKTVVPRFMVGNMPVMVFPGLCGLRQCNRGRDSGR